MKEKHENILEKRILGREKNEAGTCPTEEGLAKQKKRLEDNKVRVV